MRKAAASVIAPIARISTNALRRSVGAPKSQEIFSIASSSTSRNVHVKARTNLVSLPLCSRGGLPVQSHDVFWSSRNLVTSSIVRSSDFPKDRNGPNDAASSDGRTTGQSSSDAVESAIESARKEFEQAQRAAAEKASSTSAQAQEKPADHGASASLEENSATSEVPTITSDSRPEPESITANGQSPKQQSSTCSPSEQTSKLWGRIRSSSFDGLTSTSSLTSLASSASARTRDLATTLRTRLSNLSAQYNTYSGYSAIEALKTRIATLETSLDSARALASDAKKTYLSAVQCRSSSQRETNDLLSRKNSWTEADLSRYTGLLRKEHALSREESEAEKELERTEAEVQAAFDELMKAVMVRYHEEQIWSDRMRGMSTYGSLIVAGLNAFLFVVAILLVEPYKRKKLAQTFEERLVRAEEQSRELILTSVDKFQQSLDAAMAQREGKGGVSGPLITPQPTLEDVPDGLDPVVEESKSQWAMTSKGRKEEEERLVFASTVGVVVGAALSLLISVCWS